MDFVLAQVVNGLVYGAILFLIASGLSLIFGMMNVVNAAHGSFFMLGAFMALTLERTFGSFWIAAALAPIIPMILGLLLERYGLRMLHGRGHLDQVLLTFGCTFIVFDVVKWIWGADINSLDVPNVLKGVVFLGNIVVPKYRIFLIAFGIVLAILLWQFIERSRFGAMVRAGVDDQATAEGMGVNVALISSTVFVLGVGLAALGGVLAAPIQGVYIGMDFEVLIPAFMVVVIGGLGSLTGAFLGSMLMGLATTFGEAYVPQAAMFLTYILMIVVLIVRPNGLFGLSRAGFLGFQGSALSGRAAGPRVPSALSFRIFAIVCVALAAVPFLLSSYHTSLATEILIFAIFAMSLDLLIGYTGLLSFGHAAFFSISAYAVVILNVHYGIDAWVGVGIGVLLAAIAALLIGSLCIRVSGISFLMLTLAFSQLVFSIALKWRGLTGGSDGIGGLVRPSIFGYNLQHGSVIFFVALAGLMAAGAILYTLTRSSLGASLIGVRENESRMQAIGYRVRDYKLLSFVIAGTLAGFAGALYALFNGFVSSDLANWTTSGDVTIMVILGGTGTVFGPILGAAIFLLMKNVVSSYTQHWMLFIGLTFSLCVMFLPTGLWGIFTRVPALNGAFKMNGAFKK